MYTIRIQKIHLMLYFLFLLWDDGGRKRRAYVLTCVRVDVGEGLKAERDCHCEEPEL